ncbi:aspartyl protease family protein [[Actinomadura] parvosata]|uniref:aspartyl protease family protein n=1 Tax=[Actinomadura] parvosata TaxID=1955412 RepID=UPI00406D4B7D
MADGGRWDRRSLLRGAAVLAGAAATVPLLGEDAARRRGYVGLLANRFPDAEKYLKTALGLAPDDKEAHQLLGDCYIRQDKFASAAPHWAAAGEESYAQWFAAVRGEAYQVHGDTARVPFAQMDPMPLVEVSVNGGAAKRFMFYTGAPNLSLRASVAREAGLSPVFSQETDFGMGLVRAHWGILDSFKLGGIELRNIPVSWTETTSGEDVDADSDGLIGMWVFYHLLPTFDYAGRQLILRRRTAETASAVRAAAARAGVRPLPVWLAREQYLHSVGSFTGAAGSATGVVGVNFGGVGELEQAYQHGAGSAPIGGAASSPSTPGRTGRRARRRSARPHRITHQR